LALPQHLAALRPSGADRSAQHASGKSTHHNWSPPACRKGFPIDSGPVDHRNLLLALAGCLHRCLTPALGEREFAKPAAQARVNERAAPARACVVL